MYCRRCCRGIPKGEITIEEFNEKMKQGAIAIDVRSPQEYKEGHIPGAINIPEYEIRKRMQEEMPKKNQVILVYCEYGGRSRNGW